MHTLLEQIAARPDTDDVAGLDALVRSLRPTKPEQGELAVAAFREMLALLAERPHLASGLRRYLLNVLAARNQTSLYTDLGILSSDGFFSELFRRIAYRLLPPALDDLQLSDCLDRILFADTDQVWISAIPDTDWLAMFDLLCAADMAQAPQGEHTAHLEILEAIQTLSYRISAMGLEPTLIRIHPEIEAFESPFLMQNAAMHRYLKHYGRSVEQTGDNSAEDASHLLVMLDQCNAVIAKIRKNSLNKGTSVALTYLLVRLTQNIDRLQKLLAIVDAAPVVESIVLAADRVKAGPSPQRKAAVLFARELIEGHRRKYAVRELVADNITLLARNVTENASRTGEHYIAENRAEYRAMFRSSAGAGFIVGFMALLKILTSYLRAAPLVEAFLFSLNYSFGFMLCHILHFTFATKQPAMTASRIAAGLHSRDGRNIDLASMAELIVKVFRTQFIAVLGNLATAIPTAYLIATGYFYLNGQHLVTPDKAQHLLHDIDPFTSLALLHGAVAGVCLFVAGLISGYYDNKALYTRMTQRVVRVRWLRSLMSDARLDRLGRYIEGNLGGLMGNFYLGIMLASIGTIGYMLGLPIDVRHVTLSSTNLAVALVGLDHHVSWQVVLISAAGIAGIGAMNLLVSFGLALWVALRSRQVTFNHGIRLLKVLLKRFFNAPKDFFIAPKDLPVDDSETAAAVSSARESGL